jgi:hypothetical protein
MVKPPMIAQNIKHNLEELLTSLIESGIVDDQNFPVLRRIPNKAWEVTFANTDYVSITMDDVDYAVIQRELAEKRSYTAKMIDGGLLQLMYRFENGRLVQHRLAYYPSPDLRPFHEDPDVYLRDELFLDIVSRRIVPFPLRFDFNEAAARDVVHPRCHLTLGDVKGCRIPVSAPLTPRWFIEFVLWNFYQTDKHDLVRSLPDHRLHFARTITANECRLIHMVVPERLRA